MTDHEPSLGCCKQHFNRVNKYTGYSTAELAELGDKLLKEGDRLGKEVNAMLNHRKNILDELDVIINEVRSRKKV